MEAEKISTLCAVRELTFVEAGIADGTKGGWFQDRKRNRTFITEQEIAAFNDRLREESARRRRVYASYTS